MQGGVATLENNLTCIKILKAGGQGDIRGWDGWMALLTLWTWVWASSGSWWWTGKPDMLQSMGLQTVGHIWVTELTEVGIWILKFSQPWKFWMKSINLSNKLQCCIFVNLRPLKFKESKFTEFSMKQKTCL